MLQNCLNSKLIDWGPLSDTISCGKPWVENIVVRLLMMDWLEVDDRIIASGHREHSLAGGK